MAQYKRSREEYCCNSVNSNELDQNPPKRSCSKSDAGVSWLSDLLFADDDVDDMNPKDLQAAQHALLLDMMTSLHQEINSCNSRMNSFCDAEVRYPLDSPNFGDNCSSSCVVGESAPVNSPCKMDDEICTVSIDYLLRATDEELGIPPTSLSDLNGGDNRSSSCVVGESAPVNLSCKMDGELCTVSIDYLLHATDEELGIPPTSLSVLNESDDEATFYSHETENVWNGLTLQIELLSGIETVEGIDGHLIPAHAM